jgi:hypothetical protein
VAAVVEESPPDDVANFLQAFRLQVASFGVSNVLVDRVSDRRDVLKQHADLTGRPPAPDQFLRRAPNSQIERLPDLLTAKRALHPNGTCTAIPASPLASVWTSRRMSSVDREGHAGPR